MVVLKRLMKVLGGRVFWSFGVVTFLMAGLLATVNLASRFALKKYVDGQLQRTPWDLSVYQSGSNDPADTETPNKMRRVHGVTQVETLAILRAKLPEQDTAITIDGKPLQTPWLTLIAASDPSLLPPELHLALQSGKRAEEPLTPILAVVGPERAMGSAYLSLQGAREFELNVKINGNQRSIFQTPISGVIRLDRDEFTRWLMDQMGADAYIPSIGVVLLMPYRIDALKRFDMLALGMIPPDLMTGGEDQHVQRAEYIPEVIHLARINRDSLISGWDIPKSLSGVSGLCERVLDSVNEYASQAFDAPEGNIIIAADHHKARIVLVHGPQGETAHSEHAEGEDHDHSEEGNIGSSGFLVDSTTQVLLQRMQRTARLIGLVSLLVALPLLWMGWMLAANLSGLLMLNERRTLGLMRLRGVPGRELGRVLLMAITAGGIAGGVAGILFGSLLPLMIYERGRLPLHVLLQPQQILLFALFLMITVILAVLVSWNLITYAVSISPLEASGRFASSETARTKVKFGALQLLCLVLGSVVLAGWVLGFSATRLVPVKRIEDAAAVLDFLGLPLFLYGAASLIASRRSWIQAFMGPLFKSFGGRLGMVSQRHMAAKPHRSVAFMLIVALMASVSLYPTIASRAFEDKATRGAEVQIGSEWHFTFNAPDLAPSNQLRGGLQPQLNMLAPAVQTMVSKTAKVPGVQSVSYMVEALLPSFYLPGYGMNGVPLYLIGDTNSYLANAYSEPELGINMPFKRVLTSLSDGNIAMSAPVADFWEVSDGNPLRLGLDSHSNSISLSSAGTLAYLPGMPPRSVTDRQGYVQARVDYLNYLFDRNAYVVASAANPKIADLQVLIPRVILLVRADQSAASNLETSARVQGTIIRGFPSPPLEIHTLAQEVQKVGNDMFVSLALENMRIYLIGGLLLALIAILSIAYANYTEDRRTLALMRIRGASPEHMRRFLAAMLVSPALLGLILGIVTALIAGYGLTNHVWKLREIRSVVQLLKTHLVVSGSTVGVTILLLALVGAVAWLFSMWSFRSSAHERIREA